MDNQFLNQNVPQNDVQTNYQQQQSSNQYAYQQQQPLYQQPYVIVQVPLYSEEQIQMQKKIQNDQFDLIKNRGKLRLEIIEYLIILSVILMMSIVDFYQLMSRGYVSGSNLARFLSSELYILNTVYMTAIVMGVLSIVMIIKTFVQLRKVRVDSVPPFAYSLKFGLITGAFSIAIMFFLASFWLLMNLSTYWLFFLCQSIVLISAMIMTFRVIDKAEAIAKVVRISNLPIVKKPLDEAYYYKPMSYKQEIQYIQ